MTVLGPVDSSELGQTSIHEHIFCDLTHYLIKPKNQEEADFLEEPVNVKNLYALKNSPYSNRDNALLDDMDQALREVALFKKYGGGTIVEVTSASIGRDVVKLAEVSKRLGIHIVAGMSEYVYTSHPPKIAKMSVDELAQSYIDEIKNGVGDTGIKPGIIGEVGATDLNEAETKVLRAAARASLETGLALSIHTSALGHDVLDILIKEEGVSPDRIMLDHRDTVLTLPGYDFETLTDHLVSLGDRGCYLAFDICGGTTTNKFETFMFYLPTDLQRVQAIKKLCLHGFSDRVVLGQDVGNKHHYREFGGPGYSHIITEFKDYLAFEGISEKTMNRFYVDNPARLLSIT